MGPLVSICYKKSSGISHKVAYFNPCKTIWTAVNHSRSWPRPNTCVHTHTNTRLFHKHLYYSYGIYLQKYCGLYTTINSKFRPELRAAFEIFVLKKSCALNYERSQLCGMQLSAVGEIMDHIHLSWERIDILYSSNCLNSQYNHIYNHNLGTCACITSNRVHFLKYSFCWKYPHNYTWHDLHKLGWLEGRNLFTCEQVLLENVSFRYGLPSAGLIRPNMIWANLITCFK